MSKPKISILLPAYNHAKYIGETIESVLNQTFSDFELLISDDCSTDNTVQVIKGYADERITGIYFDKNQGTVRALNYLLEMAKGEYIAVLGSDDVWESDKLEKQLAVLENDASLAACFSWATIIDQNSDVINDEKIFPIYAFEFKNCDKTVLLKEFFARGNRLCHSSVLIRSDVHRKIGEYNVAYRQLHDYDLWVRLLMGYNVHIIESPLVKYRFVVNSENVSRNSEKNNFRMWNEAEEILLYLIENISDEDFLNVFKEDIFRKDETTATHIICEKYLLLLKYKLWGANNTSLSLRYLFKNLSQEMLLCLEKDYGISLNDIYEQTSSFKTTYYAELYDEMQELRKQHGFVWQEHKKLVEQYGDLEKEKVMLQRQIDEIYASNSWKVTKPMRKFTEKMKNMKGKLQ